MPGLGHDCANQGVPPQLLAIASLGLTVGSRVLHHSHSSPTAMRLIHLLGLIPLKPVRCPSCRLRIDGRHVWDHRKCAACGAVVRIRRLFLLTTYVLALVISVGIAFAVGNRDDALLSLVVLLVVPTLWAMVMVSIRLFPVDIEIVRAGWTPGDSDADREIERQFELLRQVDAVLGTAEVPAPGLEALTDDDPGGRLPLSAPLDPPVSLEGIAIAIACTAMLAYHIYTALEPHF
jgi:hypothetical protein